MITLIDDEAEFMKEKINKMCMPAPLQLFLVKLAVLLIMTFLMPFSATALIGMKTGAAPLKFTLQDLNGETVNVGKYFGVKPVILVFWKLNMNKSFLDYSLDELRFMNDFFTRLHDEKGLEIFGIYTPEEENTVSEDELQKVKNLVNVNKIKFPILIDRGFSVFRRHGVIALPSTIMVEKNGKIGFIYPSFPLAAQSLFADEIESLLGMTHRITRKEMEREEEQVSRSGRLYHYARQMHKKGMVEQALSPLEKSLKLEPDNAKAHNLMGIILWKRGDYEGAVKEFEHALELDDGSAQAHFNYGLLLFDNEKYKEARNHIERSIAINEDLAEARYMLGMIYKKEENSENALKEFERARVHFEKMGTSEGKSDTSQCRISTLYEMSRLYYERGESKQAIDLLLKATRISLGIEGKAVDGILHQSRDMMLYE